MKLKWAAWMSRVGETLRPLAPAAVALGLVACGSSEPSGDSAGQADASAGAAAVNKPDARLVAAVPVQNGSAALGLRFELLDRPLPNGDFRVRLVWTATAPSRALQADYVPAEGLRAVAGTAVLRESNLAADTVIERVLTLHAAAAGMYLVQLTVRNDVVGGSGASGGNSLFALPVLVEPAPVSTK
jgi:hypothetical protein